MRRVRLRWRLAFSHALLAILLVAFAGNRIDAQSRATSRAEALAAVERDADVLAARAARAYPDAQVLADLIGDEQKASRQAEIVAASRHVLAGTDLSVAKDGSVAHSGAATALARVLQEGAPATFAESNSFVVSASPVVVNSALVGVAVVVERVAQRSLGLTSLGVSNWLGVLIILLAAGAGWLLAWRLSRPIAELTDDVRSVALGQPGAMTPRSASPEVDTLAAAVRGMAVRVRRRDEVDGERRDALRALTRRLAHQLRTPLAILRLRLDDLADPTLPDDRREVLANVVADQIDRLDVLGRQLAGLDPARWELRTEQVDLDELARQLVQRTAPLASWGGIALAFNPATGGNTVVAADAGLIDDALSNVVQNAIKYTPRGGRIEVSVTGGDDIVTIAVADNGPGIKPEERELVVRGGVRGSAGSAVQGTGHGLAVVADAIERHGGRLELGGRAHGGTVVRLVLPVVHEMTEPEEDVASATLQP